MKKTFYWKMVNCPVCSNKLRAKMKVRIDRNGCINVQVDHYIFRNKNLYFVSTCNLRRKDFLQIYDEALEFLVSKNYTVRENKYGNSAVLVVGED